MDQDRIKGNVDDVKGRVKRQAGEWTDDKDLQTEGIKDQVKGKAQNLGGKMKDAARDVRADIEGRDTDHTEDRDRKKRAA